MKHSPAMQDFLDVAMEVRREFENLAEHMARLCDEGLAGKDDTRCAACPFRQCNHAGGAPKGAVEAFSDTVEGLPTRCATTGGACAGSRELHPDREGGHVDLFWHLVRGSSVSSGFYEHLFVQDDASRIDR